METSAIRAANTENWIAVLPLGATEQHGPHLPLETDTLIARGLANRLSNALPEALPVTFLDAEAIGYSPEHLDFPGTKSLDYKAATERWIAKGEELADLGIRKLVLLNAHGGNSPLMTIVATELRCRQTMLCVTTSWTRFGLPEGLLSDARAQIDIHAGEVETSVMLALHPERVDMKEAKDFASRQSIFLKENRYLSAYGRHGFGWKIQDLNKSGATGNASAATAAKGEKIIMHSVNGLKRLLEEVDRFDLSQLENPSIQRR